MSLVVFITSSYTFKNFAKTGLITKNYVRNTTLEPPPSVLKIETKPKSRFLKSAKGLIHNMICKCCVGFGSSDAASSFNFNIGQFGANERASGGSDDFGVSKGDAHGNNDISRGGGDNTGNGNGGRLGGNDDGKGLKWWCWWLYEASRNYNQLGNPSPEVIFARIFLPILKMTMLNTVEPVLEAIPIPVLVPIFWLSYLVQTFVIEFLQFMELMFAICYGVMVAVFMCVLAAVCFFLLRGI